MEERELTIIEVDTGHLKHLGHENTGGWHTCLPILSYSIYYGRYKKNAPSIRNTENHLVFWILSFNNSKLHLMQHNLVSKYFFPAALVICVTSPVLGFMSSFLWCALAEILRNVCLYSPLKQDVSLPFCHVWGGQEWRGQLGFEILCKHAPLRVTHRCVTMRDIHFKSP